MTAPGAAAALAIASVLGSEPYGPARRAGVAQPSKKKSAEVKARRAARKAAKKTKRRNR